MALAVKKIDTFLAQRWKTLILLGIATIAAAACSPKPQAAQDTDDYMRSRGYSRAPQILSVTANGNMVSVSGKAVPEGRVRFLYGDQRAIGVTADSKGRFSADLPVTPQGTLFDVSMEDSGQLMQAEGRLFVPPGAPQKAVLLRAGAPSLPVMPRGTGIAVVDYDAAGAMMVTGAAAPGAAISLTVGEEIWPKQPAAAANGLFTAICQIPPPEDEASQISLSVKAGQANWLQMITVSRPPEGDHISATPGGWRIDWALPGGGSQTTLVF